MKNLTIIIPIHKKVSEELLKNCVESIKFQTNTKEKINLLFVIPPDDEIEKQITDLKIDQDKIISKTLINDGITLYQNQVNFAVENITTKYFTVLEFDDELSNVYIKNVKTYIKYYPDVDVFLPLIIEANTKNEAIKLTNESPWSRQNVGENEEIGFLNKNVLNTVSDFKLSGAIIKTDSFKNIGGYKTKIQLTFMYEYLLRSLNNGHKIMTIPKVIYKHLMDREGSVFDIAMKETTIQQRKFWFETAKKEYLFNNDRDIDISKMYE